MRALGVWPAAALLTHLALPALAASKDQAPLPPATLASMSARDTSPAAPILMRAFKKEGELEVWKRNRSGVYVLLKTFPVCRWSGQLGPKQKQGDRQVPEGFYSVAPRQLNPNSAYHLSFDIGYPNAFDRAHGASGSAIMVHGICSSAGCFAMTNAQVQEIYGLAREAFAGGQAAFQFQSFPFRMSAANMARHRTDRNIAFWRQLKEGSDRFEATGEEPVVSVVAGRYAFAPSRDPAREALAVARRADEEARTATLVAEGSAAILTTYADGGQHATFAALMSRGVSLGDVSRPEALPLAGREVVVIAARPRKPGCSGSACPVPPARSEVAGLMAQPAPVEGGAAVLFAARPLGWLGPVVLPAASALPGSAGIVPPKLVVASAAPQ